MKPSIMVAIFGPLMILAAIDNWRDALLACVIFEIANIAIVLKTGGGDVSTTEFR